MTALLLSLGLGFVSGLRTFTPVAAVMLVRGGIWGIVLAVAAVGEYVVDVLPNTPSRTQARGLSARVVSGAFVGWMIATMHDGSGMFGAIAGIAGPVIGAYAGQAARLAAISASAATLLRSWKTSSRSDSQLSSSHAGNCLLLTPRSANESPR